MKNIVKSTFISSFITLLLFTLFPAIALSQTAKPLTGDAVTLKHNATYANPSSGFSTIFIDSGVVKVQRSDGTTKAAIFLTDLSATSPLSYNNGTGAFSLAGLSSLGTANYIVGVNSGATAWEYKQLIAGTNITITPGTGSITIDATTGAVNFNDIGDATASGTINLVSYAQELTANSLAGATALKISSTSTAAASNAQRLFEVANSGANATSTQTTYSGYFTNTKTGTSSTNVAGYFSASGASNNYGLIVANGRVGIGTTAPLGPLDLGTASGDKIFLAADSFTRIGFGLSSTDLRIFSEGNTGAISLGFQQSGSPYTYTEKLRLNTLGSLISSQSNLTSSQPLINHSATWNSGATQFINFDSNIADTASASTSLLFRLRVGSVQKFAIRKDGYLFANSGFIGNYAAFYDHVAFGYIDFAGSPSTDAGFFQLGSVGSSGVNTKAGGEILFRYGGSDRAKLENSGANWDFSVSNNYFKVKQLATTVNNAGNSGTALTINWNNGGKQYTTLTGNVTLTLSNPVAGTTYTLTFIQDGTGTHTVTWPASVKWSGGSAPTITTGAGKTSIVRLEYAPDGTTNYYGTYTLDYN